MTPSTTASHLSDNSWSYIRGQVILLANYRAAARDTLRGIDENALEEHLFNHDWQVEGIKKAQQSLACGRSTSLEEVVQDLRAKINRRVNSEGE